MTFLSCFLCHKAWRILPESIAGSESVCGNTWGHMLDHTSSSAMPVVGAIPPETGRRAEKGLYQERANLSKKSHENEAGRAQHQCHSLAQPPTFGVGMSWGRVCSTGLLEGNSRKGCFICLSQLAAPCSGGAGTANQEAHASALSYSSTCLAPHTSCTHSLT